MSPPCSKIIAKRDSSSDCENVIYLDRKRQTHTAPGRVRTEAYIDNTVNLKQEADTDLYAEDDDYDENDDSISMVDRDSDSDYNPDSDWSETRDKKAPSTVTSKSPIVVVKKNMGARSNSSLSSSTNAIQTKAVASSSSARRPSAPTSNKTTSVTSTARPSPPASKPTKAIKMELSTLSPAGGAVANEVPSAFDDETGAATVAPFQCRSCKQRFVDADALTAHRDEHRRTHECDRCHQELFDAKAIDYHLRWAHAPVPNPKRKFYSHLPVCKHCEEPYPEFESLRKRDDHTRLAHPTKWMTKPCEWCPLRFCSRSRRNHHVYVEHPETGLITACDICGLLVNTKTINSHQATHGRVRRKFLCTICGNEYKTITSLNLHMNFHTNTRPYVCEYVGCGKAFRAPSTLSVHRLSHTGERPHKCAHCERRFAHYTDMRRHQRGHGGEEKRFECSRCGHKFWENKYLVQHRLKCQGGPNRMRTKRRISDDDDDDNATAWPNDGDVNVETSEAVDGLLALKEEN